jgi:hypothetical protein
MATICKPNQVFGTPLPKITTITPMGEAMAQCRIELVRRETELIFLIAKEGHAAFRRTTTEGFLVETRADIAKIDALFSYDAVLKKEISDLERAARDVFSARSKTSHEEVK